MPEFLCLSQQRMFVSHQILLLLVQGSGSSLRHIPQLTNRRPCRDIALPRGKPHPLRHKDTVTAIFPGWFGAVEELFYHSLVFFKLYLSSGFHISCSILQPIRRDNQMMEFCLLYTDRTRFFFLIFVMLLNFKCKKIPPMWSGCSTENAAHILSSAVSAPVFSARKRGGKQIYSQHLGVC